MAATVQAFVAAALAISEFQVQPFHPPRAGIVFGDAMDRRQAALHQRLAPVADTADAIAAIMRAGMDRFIADR